MVSSCHICGSDVAENGADADGVKEGFICHDCGNPTCSDCSSIGVALDTDHCKRCRG